MRTEAVLGVDTLVTLDGHIYGKPADESEARATLDGAERGDASRAERRGAAAAGERAAHHGRRHRSDISHLSEELLDWYVSVGEWRDRSGGYAIQGNGSILARSIVGDVQNVVGLPLAALLDLYPERWKLLPCK